MRASRSALVTLAGVGLVGFGLRSLERWLIFPSPPAPREAPALGADTEHAWLESPGGRVEAFLLLPEPARDRPGPLIVYAHGNGELVDGWLQEFSELRAQGVAVLLVEYPGYGRSAGTPSEESIQHALAAGYDWAASRPEIDARRIIGYGRSLGGGAICALARVRSLAALILESTFTNVRDVAAERFRVPRFLVRESFDNLALLRSYRSPLLVLHGERDSAIPVSHARKLAETAPASELQLANCGHNDCPRPWAIVMAFLGRHGLL
jgi:fermentation-respiration switch protein FrsA (DUF1100 family)